MLQDRDAKKVEISELGEFGLIEHLTRNIKIKNTTTIKGIGDDAAVLDYKEKQIVVSTDMLMENVHFNLAYTPLKHLGYKAVIVNLSDICAMNAIPKQVTISMAASNRFPLDAVEELYRGMRLACQIYEVDIIGGDTTSSQTGLAISITALGEANKDDIIYRNGAKLNDLIVLTGDIGGAYLGLQILEREQEVFKENPNMQPDLDNYQYILERQLKPEARKDIVELLEELKIKPTSMIDISDGLSSELIHICKQSQVGCNLFEEKLPLDPTVISTCEELNLERTTIAINGGEDYELLFTISLDDYDKIKEDPNFTIIGHITEQNQGMNLVTRGGTHVKLTAQGWNALLNKED